MHQVICNNRRQRILFNKKQRSKTVPLDGQGWEFGGFQHLTVPTDHSPGETLVGREENRDGFLVEVFS